MPALLVFTRTIGFRHDHPVAWCHDVGGGRSFYTALGHTKQCYDDPLFLEHLAGGVAWALGVDRP